MPSSPIFGSPPITGMQKHATLPERTAQNLLSDHNILNNMSNTKTSVSQPAVVAEIVSELLFNHPC